ncbi:MAG TPA: class I SAM-dependent methyltransferase, partial [Dehalococcoidia bacterium]|nr:class I SAM-dependent methyltransferase [Dehalococcoidia bacterium]
MTFLALKRVPEPETMDSDEEVEAYASAAAQAYLDAIDNSFVDHLARLIAPWGDGAARARVLDLGCGPGQILVKIKRRWPAMRILGLDAGPNMVEKARRDAAEAGVDIEYRVFRLGPQGERRLPCDDGEFDVALCNSTLHHLEDPRGALDELARVTKPDGAVLVRDLQRPTLLPFPLHVNLFGRYYTGEMRRLYEASVRAAYTKSELEALLRASRLNDGRSRVFTRGLTHAGIERPALAR